MNITIRVFVKKKEKYQYFSGKKKGLNWSYAYFQLILYFIMIFLFVLRFYGPVNPMWSCRVLPNPHVYWAGLVL